MNGTEIRESPTRNSRDPIPMQNVENSNNEEYLIVTRSKLWLSNDIQDDLFL